MCVCVCVCVCVPLWKPSNLNSRFYSYSSRLNVLFISTDFISFHLRISILAPPSLQGMSRHNLFDLVFWGGDWLMEADIYVPGTHKAHRIYLYQVKKYPLRYSCTKFRGSLGYRDWPVVCNWHTLFSCWLLFFWRFKGKTDKYKFVLSLSYEFVDIHSQFLATVEVT